MPFGLFFGFDFPAEFFVFGVFGFAAFALVVYFFDRDRFFVALVGFVTLVVFRFGFVVFVGDEKRCRGCRGQARGVSRGGCGQQHQRGEQEDQQDRQFAHDSLIGVGRRAV